MSRRPRAPLAETLYGPGQAALASTRHAWGTLSTAMARLEQQPPPWTPEQLAEARQQLEAAQHLVAAVGEALSRA